MSDVTHTAGLWTLTRDPAFPAEIAVDAVVNGTIIHIALVHGVTTDEETQANAALILAAPDLLAGAKAMLAAFGSNVPYWLRAEAIALEAAVAKAEGRQS